MTIKIKRADEHKRALIFLKRKTMIHVSRINGIWHNGIILEVCEEFFVLKDRESLLEETILFSELKKPLAKTKEVRND